jgi:hypothetical protein
MQPCSLIPSFILFFRIATDPKNEWAVALASAAPRRAGL